MGQLSETAQLLEFYHLKIIFSSLYSVAITSLLVHVLIIYAFKCLKAMRKFFLPILGRNPELKDFIYLSGSVV